MKPNQNKLIGIKSFIVQEEISIECSEYEGTIYFYILQGDTLVGQEITEERATERAKEMTGGTAQAMPTVKWERNFSNRKMIRIN